MSLLAKGVWVDDFSNIPRAAFDVEVIANSLSKICRYAGNCDVFYSVAQHSVLVSQYVSPKNAMAGLMHDVAEMFTSDIPTPYKNEIEDFGIEELIERQIAKEFGFPYPHSAEIDVVDKAMWAIEMPYLYKDIPAKASRFLSNRFVPKNMQKLIIYPQPPNVAKEMFILRYHEIVNDNQ